MKARNVRAKDRAQMTEGQDLAEMQGLRENVAFWK